MTDTATATGSGRADARAPIDDAMLTPWRNEGSGQIEITESDLRRLCPRARSDYIRALVDNADILDQYGITATPARWCAFMANVAAETGYLTIIRENMNYSAANLLRVWPSRYPNSVAGRAKAALHAKRGAKFIANYNYGFRLGNRGRNTDDGWNFRGALLLQATGRDQSAWLAREMGVPYDTEPELWNVIDRRCVEVAARTWCTKVGDLNTYADRGLFRACCNGINRGNPRASHNPIGWAGRQAAHRKARAIWGDDAARPAPGVLSEGASGWEVETYQRRLAALGYHVGAIDGDFGDNTATAVINFQRVNGLTVDGMIGPETRAALASDEALPKPISEARAEATAADLAAAGSSTVNAAQRGRAVGATLGLGGVGSTVWQYVTQFNAQAETVRAVAEPAAANVTWLLQWWPLGLILAGWLVWHFFGAVILARVADHRAGRHVGR